jgi:hypothetical protein
MVDVVAVVAVLGCALLVCIITGVAGCLCCWF